jgi:hypothetical protein
MHPSFKVFMSRLIDYAGLFPPAELAMAKAFQNYIKYREEPESWMLSRFICPASRLNDVHEHRELIHKIKTPLQFTVLVRSGKDKEEFLSGLNQDLNHVSDFKMIYTENVSCNVFEMRLPPLFMSKTSVSDIHNFLDQIAELIEARGSEPITPFYEYTLSNDWKSQIGQVVEAISQHSQAISKKHFNIYQPAGFKLRCGGDQSSMYPTTEQVAFLVHYSKKNRVPLKATAGLHHPIRHLNQEAQVTMHGFINVFTAGIFAHILDLEETIIREIVEEEQAEHFVFSGNGLSWKNYSVNTDQISQIRSKYFISFGSCSFDEPRADLQALSLL